MDPACEVFSMDPLFIFGRENYNPSPDELSVKRRYWDEDLQAYVGEVD
jgi:hypothetical protein